MKAAHTHPSGDFTAYDSESLQQRYVRTAEQSTDQYGKQSQVTLAIDGITCAGCIARIESRAAALSGVESVRINPTSHRAIVTWDMQVMPLSRLLEAFAELGYPAVPYETREQERKTELEHRRALIRIVVAAALGMQVMMIVTGLYFGEASGMEADHRELLRFTAMILTAPVLVFCGAPFFRSAIRDIRHGSIGVDVPVSIALLVAFGGSVAATIGHNGQVYYESIAMFIFLLLCARFLELTARRKSLATVLRMGKSTPEMANLLDEHGGTSAIDVNMLQPGDRVRVFPGDIIPADGTIETGTTTVNESILTGESEPVAKRIDSPVIAGSINVENGFTLVVNAMAHENVLSQLVHLTERAQGTKPRLATVADRVSSYFVLGVLLIAAAAGLFWWFRDAAMWLPVVVSTLVVACPCALSLATPAAYVSAMGALTRKGIIPMRGEFLEDISTIDHVVVDKTGTLTLGNLRLSEITRLGDEDESAVLAIAAELNRESSHPLAVELRSRAGKSTVEISEVQHTPGAGVTGKVDECEYAVGSSRFIQQFMASENLELPAAIAASANSYCLLATRTRIVAVFEFVDQIRPEAARVIRSLKDSGCDITLLSGDHHKAVERVAREVGIDDARARQSPEDKLACLRELESGGRGVAMIGDGMNDAPVMAAAAVSFAMGRGPDVTRTSADLVLLNENLADVLDVIELSTRTRRIIRQNFTWAIAYNLLAIPAAVSGMVPPWMAAIGMSASSVIVSVNALRLLRGSGKTASKDHFQPGNVPIGQGAA